MAQELSPPDGLLAKALSHAEQACVAFNCRIRSVAKQRRRNAIKSPHSLRAIIRPSHYILTATLPEQAPSRKLNIPFVAGLVKRCNYTGVSRPGAIVKEMPIAGDIPCIIALPPNVTTATTDLGDVRGALSVTSASVLKSLSKPNGLRLKQK